MLNLTGWIGDPGISADAARRALVEEDAGARTPAAQIATGAQWGCCGPYLSQQGFISVVVRGELLWRTDESAVLAATNPADAISQAYRLWGSALLERLYGRFALAVLDHGANTALLAVDRMGIEPLAYCHHSRALLFATSAERIARFPGVSTQISRQALLSYIYFHMIPSPQTVFANVRKLPPATAVEWRNNTLREFTYWKPTFARNGGADSYEALKESLHASLTAGVRAAGPDSQTGAFLSGGLDSSTVAGFLARAQTEPARTFSIGFGFDDYDELRYARIANHRFGCDSREYVVTAEDISELLPKVARAYDEPFGNASAIPTFCCARLATQHGVAHLLAGDGGDEIFAGNKRYAEQKVFERYQHVPALLRSVLLEPVLGALPSALQVSVLRKGRNYIAQARTALPDRFENWNFLHRLGAGTMLHPDFVQAVNVNGPLEHMRSVYQSAPPDADLVDRMLYYDWRFTLADNDLRKVGRMCELAGVRVSYPMLHQDVIDVSNRVPPGMKMEGLELRSFYKRAMMDFLPHEIINKSKHGFGLPFGLWLQQSPRLAQQIDANLTGLRSRGIVRPEFIDRLRSLHGAEDARYYGVLIFTLSMLEQWFSEHGLSP